MKVSHAELLTLILFKKREGKNQFWCTSMPAGELSCVLFPTYIPAASGGWGEGCDGAPSSSKLETAEPNPRRLEVNWRDKKNEVAAELSYTGRPHRRADLLSDIVIEQKKALYFKAVYCWNKINIKLSATLIFLISTSLFFSNGCFHMLLVQSDSLRLIIKNFRELQNRSQGKFKYRPYNPLAIATFIFRHNNLTKPGWKERFTSFILIKSIKDE